MAVNREDRRKGFPSRYKVTYENGWDLKNTGYDYDTIVTILTQNI